MRLSLLSKEVLLQFRLRVPNPNDIFPFRIDIEIAVIVADGAIALGDLAFAFRCQSFIERDGVCYGAAVAGSVVSFWRHNWRTWSSVRISNLEAFSVDCASFQWYVVLIRRDREFEKEEQKSTKQVNLYVLSRR